MGRRSRGSCGDKGALADWGVAKGSIVREEEEGAHLSQSLIRSRLLFVCDMARMSPVVSAKLGCCSLIHSWTNVNVIRRATLG